MKTYKGNLEDSSSIKITYLLVDEAIHYFSYLPTSSSRLNSCQQFFYDWLIRSSSHFCFVLFFLLSSRFFFINLFSLLFFFLFLFFFFFCILFYFISFFLFSSSSKSVLRATIITPAFFCLSNFLCFAFLFLFTQPSLWKVLYSTQIKNVLNQLYHKH